MIATDVEPGFLTPGQEAARAVVLRAAARDRLQRTLLVHGAAGAGKGQFVDDLLALLFCTEPDASRRPCNACRGCRDARARSHPDLAIGSPDLWRATRGAGESAVTAARRWLGETAGAPVASDRRVVLVERIDQANEQTQNVLLKALEEPGPRQMFVLVADEPARLLPTIRSRSQALRIGPVPREVLADWLVEHERLPVDQADALARIAAGRAGHALRLARSPELIAWRRRVQAELIALLSRDRAERFAAAPELLTDAARQPSDAADEAPASEKAPPAGTTAEQRAAALRVLEAWTAVARDLMLASAGRADLASAALKVDGFDEAAGRLDVADLARFLERVERVRDALRENAAPRLALEVVMLAWPTLSGA